MSRPKYFRGALLASGVLAGLAVPSAAFAVNSTAVALTTDNKITTFETSFPGEAGAPVAVKDELGADLADKLVAIDVRPQNGALYALGYDATAKTLQLYALSSRTGVAKKVGGTFAAAAESTATTSFGFDFNPTADRIRVVSDVGQNGRVNPNTGTYTADTAINPTTVKVDGAAYTNNQQNAAVTTLYTLSGADNKLYLQSGAGSAPSPNGGLQTDGKEVKVGGTAVDFDSVGGFDITPGVNVTANNAGAPAGSGGFIASNTTGGAALSIVDLSTGAAAPVGLIGDGKTKVQGLAIQQEAVAGGLPSVSISGATGADLKLRRFNTTDPSGGKEVPITGVAATDIPVAIDWRPQTGQLVLLAISADNTTAKLYNVDPQNPTATTAGGANPGDATATLVGTGAKFVDASGVAVPLPVTANYDIDFNPTVDRVRVVSSTGLNLRINPNTGLGVDGTPATADTINPDGAQNAAATTTGIDVSGTAYTNSFGQTIPTPPSTTAIGTTTQYGLSAGKDQLLIQNPPNAGTQTAPLGIKVNGAAFDFTSVRGFDVPSGVKTGASASAATGSGLAVLATAAAPGGLYSIDLATGAATLKSTIPGSPTSIALGDVPPANKDRTVPPVTGGGGGGSTPPPVVVPPIVVPPIVTPPGTTTPKPAFGSSTRITLKLRATRVSYKGPAKITYRNTNKFAVKARFSGTTPKSGKRKAIKYSTKSFTLKASRSRTLNVKLPKAAQSVLRTKKKLTIKVTLRVTAPNGKSRNVRKTLTVRKK